MLGLKRSKESHFYLVLHRGPCGIGECVASNVELASMLKNGYFIISLSPAIPSSLKADKSGHILTVQQSINYTPPKKQLFSSADIQWLKKIKIRAG